MSPRPARRPTASALPPVLPRDTSPQALDARLRMVEAQMAIQLLNGGKGMQSLAAMVLDAVEAAGSGSPADLAAVALWRQLLAGEGI